MGAVQGGAVKFDVVMDMFLVNVSGYNKLMLAAGKFQSQFVGLIRCNGSWLKGLNNQVGDYGTGADNFRQ